VTCFSAKSARDQEHGTHHTAKRGTKAETRQLLHLVFGGELTTLDRIEFSNLKALDIVGIYPNYAEAYAAWRDAAHRSVDDAHMRYFIVHLHRLLDPETETGAAPRG
jgi:Domain of unknown function (DUF4170)